MKKLLVFTTLILVMISCKKQASDQLAPEVVVQNKIPGDKVLENKEKDAYYKTLAKKGGFNNPKNPHYQPPPPPPDDTTHPQPPPPVVSNSVLFLDFDGYGQYNTQWNNPSLNNSGMSEAEIVRAIQESKEDFSIFSDMVVTTDSSVFWAAPPGKRMRCVITSSWEWYGWVGGVAFINSYQWLENTPCFVFTPGLNYDGRNVGRAISHELGHTLGLRHQSEWLNGVFVTEYYNGGSAPDAPIMGYPYAKPIARWWDGINSVGQWQVDVDIINANK